MRPRRNYDRTIPFYRGLIGLPVLETFQASYGEDGTIFGLPDSSTHLEIVRAREPAGPVSQFDQLVFYQTDEGAQQDVIASLAGHGVQPASEPAPLLGGERRRHLPGPGRARRGVRLMGYGRDVQPASHQG
jgi:YycE-like protein